MAILKSRIQGHQQLLLLQIEQTEVKTTTTTNVTQPAPATPTEPAAPQNKGMNYPSPKQ